jgi:hypothetical protein
MLQVRLCVLGHLAQKASLVLASPAADNQDRAS